MTDEQSKFSEPEPPETTGRPSGIAGGPWAWAIAVVVVVLLMYPLARWMMGEGGAGTVGVPLPAASQLQTSFEHYQAGRYQEAIASAKAALAVAPNLADAYNNLAVSYLALRQYDEATRAAEEAIRLNPDYQLAKNNLAWIQRERAASAAPPAPANPASVDLINQSLAHFKAGRFKECMTTAAESAKLNPSLPQAPLNIGICAANLKLWDEAIKSTKEAIRLDPNLQIAKNNLAWIEKQAALETPAAK